jgi:hypothetical protein
MTHPIAYYLFLAAVVLPPVALAAGFLYLVSPRQLHRAEQKYGETAKAH